MAADLIACPTCDMLHTVAPVPAGGRLRCRRCHTVLLTNRRGAIDRTLAAAFASVILMTRGDLLPVPRALRRRPAPQRLAARRRHRLPQRPDRAALPRHPAADHRHPGHPRQRARLHAPPPPPRPPARPRRRARLPPRRAPQALGDVRGLPHRRRRRAGEDRRPRQHRPRPGVLGDGRPRPAGGAARAAASTNGRYGSSSTAARRVLTARAAGLSGCRTCGKVSPAADHRLPALRHGAAPAHPLQPAAGARLARHRADVLHPGQPPADAQDPHPRPRERQHHRRRRHRAPAPRRLGRRPRRLRRQRADPRHQVRGHHLPGPLDPLPRHPRHRRPASASTTRWSSSAAGR